MRVTLNLNFNHSSSRSFADLKYKSKKIKLLQARSSWSELIDPEKINQTDITFIPEHALLNAVARSKEFPSLPEFVAGVNYAIAMSWRTWII
jgi:hypothetical protein